MPVSTKGLIGNADRAQTKVNKTGVSCTPLKVFEAFAGIGAQSKAISMLPKDMNFQVVGTSEWDAAAVISYAHIHNYKKLQKQLKTIKKMSEEEINGYLSKFTFSLNSKTPGKVTNKARGFKEILCAANKANNNFPNIKEVGPKQIKRVDVLTYSFPCQGLSIANMGRGKGISKDVDSTSNLIWEIKRILNETKEIGEDLPSFLIMENVKELIGAKHLDDFKGWIEELAHLGYATSYAVVKALNHESIQRRERVFAVSWLKGAVGKQVKKEHSLQRSIHGLERLLKENERKEIYENLFTTGCSYEDETILSTPKNTRSRVRMAEDNKVLWPCPKWKNNNHKWTVPTLTTKQDRNPNLGMVVIDEKRDGYLQKRFITPREAFMIMGFSSEDFDRVKESQTKGFVNPEKLYRQAGNSIVVTVIRDVFKVIWEMHKGGEKWNLFEEWEQATAPTSKEFARSTRTLARLPKQ